MKEEYVIFSNDDTILAVAHSADEVAQYKRLFPDCNYTVTASYDLHTPCNHIEFLYAVVLHQTDGDVLHTYEDNHGSCLYRYFTKNPAEDDYLICNTITFYVSANSIDEAKEIARDKWREWKYEKLKEDTKC